MAGAPRAWTVEWHTTARGQRPLRAFLNGLVGRNREEAIALIELAGRRGDQLRPPRSQALGDRLFELRGHEVRIPHDVLALVRRYRSEVEATGGHGGGHGRREGA